MTAPKPGDRVLVMGTDDKVVREMVAIGYDKQFIYYGGLIVCPITNRSGSAWCFVPGGRGELSSCFNVVVGTAPATPETIAFAKELAASIGDRRPLSAEP